MPRKKETVENLFEGDFDTIMDNTENALRYTRAVQRQSWRTAVGEPSIPPYGVSDALLERLHYESIVQGAERLADEGPPAQDLECPNGFGNATGNPLTVVNIGDENVVLCALSGLLESASVYNVTTRKEGEKMKHCVQRRGRPVPPSNVIVNDLSPVTDIVGSKWENGDAEPCRAVFATRRSLNFAHLCTDSDEPALDWDDTLPFPDALSVALNPLYPAEFAAVCPDGLFFGTASELALRQRDRECFHDVQAVGQRAAYNRVCYGQHPRTLLLVSRNDVASFDMRGPIGKGSGIVLFDVRHHWNLPRYDYGISAFHLMQARGHTALVATQSCLNYVDLRMPNQPLLDWSMVMPKPVDMSCAASIQTEGMRSEMIAFWSRSQCYLEVYHAIHMERPPSPDFYLDPIGSKKDVHSNGSVQWTLPPVSKRSVLWSDLPLSHLQQLKGYSKISGMALLPFNDGSQVSLLQWSPTDGLIGQLLDVRVGDDAEEEFEADPEDSFTGENLVRMQDFQYRLVDCGEYKGMKTMEDPMFYSLPGSEVIKRVTPLKVGDVLDLRKRILRDTDDDVDDAGISRLPRPFLGDIPIVQELRRQSGDVRGVENEGQNDVIENGNGELSGENVGVMAIANPLLIRSGVEDKGIESSSATTEKTVDAASNFKLKEDTRMVDKSDSLVVTEAHDHGEPFLPFLQSPESGDLTDTDEKGNSDMDGLLEDIGFGKTFDEIAAIVRRGMPHNATPLGVDELRESLESSPSIKWRDVEWHSQCEKDHTRDPIVVSTNGPLPSWVHRRVYYTKEAPPPEQVIEDLGVEKESEFGQMLTKVKNLFFTETEGIGQSEIPLEFCDASQDY